MSSSRLPASLDDKYTASAQPVFMTGIQALIRMLIDQAARDRAAGLRVGTMISGYPGSPLGGLDLALNQAQSLTAPLDIHFVPGVNEELAAATVWGSQMTELMPSTFDGVTGVWYGKSPGVDRSLDVFRHANLGGGPRHSALIAIAGDDPLAKSSTLPNASEWDFIACGMPVLYPSNIAEFIEFGWHAIALSRFTGLWVGFKAVTNLCDGGSVITVSPGAFKPVLPSIEGFSKPQSFIFVAPGSVELERDLYDSRLPAAAEYARVNQLNRITQRGSRDRLGIVAAGKTYSDLVQALHDLGLDPEGLSSAGIRLLKIGMLHPLEASTVLDFVSGLDEVVVVEEKRSLIEDHLRNLLYDLPARPRLWGKRGDGGHELFPAHGELDADAVARRLGPLLAHALGEGAAAVRPRLAELAAIEARSYPQFSRRLPNLCSGCPHSRSTVAVDGELIGGGIGCHGMGVFATQEERAVISSTAMGAEGSNFVGLAPFVDASHFTQNVGDGTFFHSASQSLRGTVASGINITFKLLYNGHVAMTGGQPATGGRDVPSLTRYLAAEGVARTIVVAEHHKTYRAGTLAPNAKVYPRDRYADAVRELRTIQGTTVLLFDQECAAEKRRARKRGKLPEPEKHVFINEDVCEGCGDCGDVSNCMSVTPVDTEFGRKTQIHQSSCNKDYSCLKGDCPSFVTVYASKGTRKPVTPSIEVDAVPEPGEQLEIRADGYRIYMPGIGGTGVVTTNQILAYAAMLDGRLVHSLDQTGLAQKGGAVLSSLVIYRGESQPNWSNKVGAGKADLVLALDLLGAVSPLNADRMAPDRTVVVGDSTLQVTAEVVRHVQLLMPGRNSLQIAIDRLTRADRNVWIEAGRLVEALFGDQMLTNTFLLGVAYQAGLLPITGSSLESAIRLNGVAVERNLQAFRYGRLARHDARAVLERTGRPVSDLASERERYLERVQRRQRPAYLEMLAEFSDVPAELQRQLAIRIGELFLFQDAAYARRYAVEVRRIRDREAAVAPGRSDLTGATIRQLHRLMAYKDEYEVARLLTKDEWTARIEATFVDPKTKLNLHPPLLREWGWRSKLELGGWFKPSLRLLAALKGVRASPLDVFGRSEVRRAERKLVGWYMDLVDQVCENLSPANFDVALALLTASDRIRGYEQIKMRNIEAVKAHVSERLPELTRAAAASRVGGRSGSA